MTTLVVGVIVLAVAAFVGGWIASRLGQPPVLGELLAGILVGNIPGIPLFKTFGTNEYLDIVAQAGVMLLLFEVGLGLSIHEIFKVGSSSLLVAILGTAATISAGTIASRIFMPPAPLASQVFVGTALAATSVGITARVLRDMGAADRREATIILGAAVIDDVLSLTLLGVITAWTASSGAAAAAGSSLGLMLKTGGVLIVAMAIGAWLRSIEGGPPLEQLLKPFTLVFVPVFFVMVGVRTNVEALLHPLMLTLPLALTAAAVLGKMACAAGVVAPGVRRLDVALGMIPRGEVTLVFAALGRTVHIGGAPLLDERGYIALVAVVILTTLIAPPALKWSLSRSSETSGPSRDSARAH